MTFAVYDASQPTYVAFKVHGQFISPSYTRGLRREDSQFPLGNVEVPAGALELRLVADGQRDVHLVCCQLVLDQGRGAREPEPHAQGQHDVGVVRREGRGDCHVCPVSQPQVRPVEQASLLLHRGSRCGVGVCADQSIPVRFRAEN